MKFRKKPDEVEAVQCVGWDPDRVAKFVDGTQELMATDPVDGHVIQFVFRLINDTLIVPVDHWVVRKGEKFIVLPPEEFAKKYEQVIDWKLGFDISGTVLNLTRHGNTPVCVRGTYHADNCKQAVEMFLLEHPDIVEINFAKCVSPGQG